MVKLIVGAFAAVLVGAAAATGATYALVAAKAPDQEVTFDPQAPSPRDTVDYGSR